MIQNFIPKELEKYVYFSGPGELAHTNDMPKNLNQLFEETKTKAREIEKIRKQTTDKF